MNNIIKIIFSIIGALVMFLLGWLANAWNNRGKVAKEVKEAITDLNEEHKKALKALKASYEEKLKKKNEIIADLKKIIERLIALFEPLQKDNVHGANRVMKVILKNKEKLNQLEGEE